jgi:hypothetical protein
MTDLVLFGDLLDPSYKAVKALVEKAERQQDKESYSYQTGACILLNQSTRDDTLVTVLSNVFKSSLGISHVSMFEMVQTVSRSQPR